MIEPVSLFDPQEASLRNWSCVNDGVMGGVSQSKVAIDEQQHLQWHGQVSLEKNGGFASVRHQLSGLNLQQFRGLCLLLKGDNKTYKLNLANTMTSSSPRFQARFQACDSLHLIYVPFSCLHASVRGTQVSAAFNPGDIRLLGFLIADKQEGPFHLSVQRISAYA